MIKGWLCRGEGGGGVREQAEASLIKRWGRRKDAIKENGISAWLPGSSGHPNAAKQLRQLE